MNNPTSETPFEESVADVQPPETLAQENLQPEGQPDPQPEFQPLDLRRRLRELLSVPERDRSDEVWDEIIELEIQLAPGNRVAVSESTSNGGGSRQNQGRHNKPSSPAAANAGAPGAQQKKHRPRAKTNRRPRPGGKPGGSSSGGGAGDASA